MKFAWALFLSVTLLAPYTAWSQDAASSEEDIVASTQSDLLTVAGGGVAGAILGLSTLSFYETPSRHVANIWTGAAVGIIAGVVVVAMGHAEKSQEDLTGDYSPAANSDFTTVARTDWHHGQLAQHSSLQAPISSTLWGTTF